MSSICFSPDSECAEKRHPISGVTLLFRCVLLFSLICPGLLSAAAETPVVATSSPFETPLTLTDTNPIDKLVLRNLKEKGVQPAFICSDAVFVRRVYLDVIGTLPTLDEVKHFLQDTNPNKRAVLIDQLLDRGEFADCLTMKWSDLLRVKSEYPVNLWPNAAQGYHHWILSCMKDNMPYDQFVKNLLTASGSNFHDPEVNFYRALQNRDPESIAKAVALTFMGTRADKWPKERLKGMSAFFSQIGYKGTATWKEEIVFFDVLKTTPTVAGRPEQTAVFPDGIGATISPGQDPRVVFAEWLIQPNNPWFARNIVNRVWSWLMGRGLIQEPDDIRPDNPPQNPELLTYLAHEFTASHDDLKQIYRIILNSQTYQLSSIPQGQQTEPCFASYPLRRMNAEVLIDAINQITGSTEEYSSLIPEPFSFIPPDQRSIDLPDGSITSPMLELFGRPSRDTGLESERNNAATSEQGLHLLNSSHIRNKIEKSTKLKNLIQSSANPLDVATNIYLTILSRYPTKEELGVIRDYSQKSGVKGRDLVIDIVWGLINSPEFLYKH